MKDSVVQRGRGIIPFQEVSANICKGLTIQNPGELVMEGVRLSVMEPLPAAPG